MASQLQRCDWEDSQRVHDSQIELAAHEVGRQLGCRIQERSVREVAAEAPPVAACPQCGAGCRSATEQRTVGSIDGPVEVTEPQAYCDRRAAVVAVFFSLSVKDWDSPLASKRRS